MRPCSWAPLLALGAASTLLLFLAMLFWLPENSHIRVTTSTVQPASSLPASLALSSAQDTAAKDRKPEDSAKADITENPFALYRLPSQLFSLPFARRLELANLALQYMYRPVPDSILRSLQQHTSLPFTQRRPPRLYTRDAFELVRYRWRPNPLLNRSLSPQELEYRVHEHSREKGEWWSYRYSYPRYAAGLEHNVSVNYTHTRMASLHATLWENIRRWNRTERDTRDEWEESAGSLFVYAHRYRDACFLRNISLKYMPACPEERELRKRFVHPLLVTAVQRSGTHYLWEVLNQLGVDVHHEGTGRHGAVSWLYAINAHSWTAWQTARTIDLSNLYIIDNPSRVGTRRFRYVFHQVRHPLFVLSTLVSKCADYDRLWQWIASMSGFEVITERQTPLMRAMLLYLLWNRHIELYADLRYTVHTTSPRSVCLWAGFHEDTCAGPRRSPPKDDRPRDTVQKILHKRMEAFRLDHAARWNRSRRASSPHSTMQARHGRRLTSLSPDETGLPPSPRNGTSHSHESTLEELRRNISDLPLWAQLGEGETDDSLGMDKYNRGRKWAGRPGTEADLSADGDAPLTPPPPRKLTWPDLDRENLMLANELRILCIEYGLPLDPAGLQRTSEVAS